MRLSVDEEAGETCVLLAAESKKRAFGRRRRGWLVRNKKRGRRGETLGSDGEEGIVEGWKEGNQEIGRREVRAFSVSGNKSKRVALCPCGDFSCACG